MTTKGFGGKRGFVVTGDTWTCVTEDGGGPNQEEPEEQNEQKRLKADKITNKSIMNQTILLKGMIKAEQTNKQNKQRQHRWQWSDQAWPSEPDTVS